MSCYRKGICVSHAKFQNHTCIFNMLNTCAQVMCFTCEISHATVHMCFKCEISHQSHVTFHMCFIWEILHFDLTHVKFHM